MIKAFKKINIQDQQTSLFQNNVAEFAKQLQINPLLSGLLVPNVKLYGIPTAVNHGLGRPAIGYLITTSSVGVVTYQSISPTPNTTIILNTVGIDTAVFDEYEEPYIVAAPITSGTELTLPLNTRDGNTPGTYIVGSALLQVFLNGQNLLVDADYDEVGTAGSVSSTIVINQSLEVNDLLKYRVVNQIEVTSTYEAPLTIAAPTLSGSTINLPADPRTGQPGEYEVDSALLQVYLNGQNLLVGEDYDEVGSAGTQSSSIVINQDLAVNDLLKFRVEADQVAESTGSEIATVSLYIF